jgi:DnaJ-class molecular chaperone
VTGCLGGFAGANGASWESGMQKNSGKKKEKCKNCEGRGLIKNGDKKMKCQRCGGTGFKP